MLHVRRDEDEGQGRGVPTRIDVPTAGDALLPAGLLAGPAAGRGRRLLRREERRAGIEGHRQPPGHSRELFVVRRGRDATDQYHRMRRRGPTDHGPPEQLPSNAIGGEQNPDSLSTGLGSIQGRRRRPRGGARHEPAGGGALERQGPRPVLARGRRAGLRFRALRRLRYADNRRPLLLVLQVQATDVVLPEPGRVLGRRAGPDDGSGDLRGAVCH
mmetsp:Transcript_19798/g.56225  ORF Transcript_19798/g.56225 Transcript_19798/m.56225 type:complete len:215 (+) Transcript_19798:359-1003(+)